MSDDGTQWVTHGRLGGIYRAAMGRLWSSVGHPDVVSVSIADKVTAGISTADKVTAGIALSDKMTVSITGVD